MIRLGSFDLVGHVVRIQSSAPLAGFIGSALADLETTGGRRDPTLTVESFADGTWSVAWVDEQRYDGPDEAVAFYDVFGAINEAAARHVAVVGHIGLHGGAIRIGDIGVAVVGHSGAGKSTLTAGLVQAGHGYIADELVAVEHDATDNQPMLHPYHRPIGMRADGAAAIGIEIPDGPFDYTFPLAAGTLGSMAGATPLGVIAFIERDPSASAQVCEVSPAHALHRLTNHTLGTWGLESETFAKLDDLVRATPSVTVRYRSIAEGVAMVEQAVAANRRS